MAEAKLSERAQKILSFLSPSPLGGEGFRVRFIRQQSLAEEFNCSRRTIGRALKQLKEAGLLVDLNRRHENRCKLYTVVIRHDKPLTPQAQTQWERYEKTFRIVFEMPELPAYYAQVTWELANIKDEGELYSKTWAGLYAITG